jgi:hypothetical protein
MTEQLQPRPVSEPMLEGVERQRALWRERSRRYRVTHRSQRQAYHAEYRQRPTSKTNKSASNRRYYLQNRTNLLAYQREYWQEKVAVRKRVRSDPAPQGSNPIALA